MVILSFGLLGIAGLLLASAGQQKNAQGYVIGSLLVSDIIERMKANPSDLAIVTPGVVGDNYLTPGGLIPYTTSATSVTSAQGCSLGVACPAGDVARADLNAWFTRLGRELPGGAGQIVIPAGADQLTRQIVVMWVEKDNTQIDDASSAARADTINCPAAVRVNAPPSLRCVNVVMKP